ncbi:hypothetical protein C4K04_4434 [Pseudomonas chlororaphis]|uniref:Uncharacterized protein n=1 Tax=Pseudomonas chlororaphis TaxID=587753 RepID=A0A3G7TSM3_9PSED|nr:hypothetical protein C4K04_4434 [Pseudomonas chlororaphis]
MCFASLFEASFACHEHSPIVCFGSIQVILNLRSEKLPVSQQAA